MFKIYLLMEDLQNITISACPFMKLWSINNIKVKCFQLAQKVPDDSEHFHLTGTVHLILLGIPSSLILPAKNRRVKRGVI